jgi:putative redox protein
MSHKIESNYLGGLRVSSTHLASNTEIITDAPVDNNGKGESFSPTDLVATALGTCMITVMGIYAEKNGILMPNVYSRTNKVMSSTPRKISKLKIEIIFGDNQLSEVEKQCLKDVALNCPVAKSLHPDLKQEIEFNF